MNGEKRMQDSVRDRETVIEIKHVDKHFGDLHVLKDINLTVKKGEVVVVLGPSGSGKSTLCRTINRLETIDSGEILFEGEPLPAEGKELARLRVKPQLLLHLAHQRLPTRLAELDVSARQIGGGTTLGAAEQ